MLRKLDVLFIGGDGLLMDLYKRPLYATLGLLGHITLGVK